MIDQFAKRLTPPTSQINAYRSFASEFFDTPASQIGAPSNKPKASRFAGNGQRPAAVASEGAGDA